MTKDQTPSREEVIRWAREAGFEPEVVLDGPYAPYAQEWLNNMQRFASIVAAAAIHDDLLWQAETETAVLGEREACAKVCEAEAEKQYDNMDIPLTIAADLIRARKENT